MADDPSPLPAAPELSPEPDNHRPDPGVSHDATVTPDTLHVTATPQEPGG